MENCRGTEFTQSIGKAVHSAEGVFTNHTARSVATKKIRCASFFLNFKYLLPQTLFCTEG